MRRAPLIVVVGSFTFAIGTARATPPYGPPEVMVERSGTLVPRIGEPPPGPPSTLAAIDVKTRLGKLAAFLVTMQEPSGDDAGGIHEVEMAGDAKAWTYIQSDNT